MSARAEERIEKARFTRAAERRGISLSDWVRRRLAEAAEADLGIEEPMPPSQEDIAEALKAYGALRGSGLRERVKRARATPWTVRR